MKRIAPPVPRALLPVVLLAVLTASCSSTSWAGSRISGSAGVSTGAGGTTGRATSAAAQTAGAVSMASCSGTTCTVTLGGTGSRVFVLGSEIVLKALGQGRASLRAGAVDVTCTTGTRVSAGPLELTCTTVGPETVTFTVVLR